MDRQIIYPGQIPLETDQLTQNRASMVALGKLISAVLGTGNVVNGLTVSPNTPAALNVVVSSGELYSLQNIDNTAFSSLPADIAHTCMKQGISLDPLTIACAAPTTAGFSVNYLIEATFQEVDGAGTVLPYYNASNPAQAYAGPANSGTAQATLRQAKVFVQAKPGIAANTGTQVTPSVDAGYVALAVVTVANGQTTITAANIAAVTSNQVMTRSILDAVLAPIPGRLVRTTIYTRVGGVQMVSVDGGTPTTTGASVFTKHPAATTAQADVQGAGGGGGGGVSNSTQGAISGGGGGGACAVWLGSAAALSGQIITVGTGGSGGISNTVAGTAGGSSSIGSVITSPGGGASGAAGPSGPPTASGGTGLSSAPTGANLFAERGGPGTFGLLLAANNGIGGLGGYTRFGPGPAGPNATTSNGNDAVNFGTGGSGGNSGVGNTGGITGGKGADGIIVIRELA